MSKYIKTLIGTRPLNTKDKKALASFVKNSKRIGKKLQTILIIFLWQKKQIRATRIAQITIKSVSKQTMGIIMV